MLRGESYGSFNWAPGTPALFAAAAWLRGYSYIAPITHSHGVAQYVQWLVEMATIGVVGAFAWRVGGVWAAFVAVAAIATYPSLVEVTRTYLSEPLGGLMLVAMVTSAVWAAAGRPAVCRLVALADRRRGDQRAGLPRARGLPPGDRGDRRGVGARRPRRPPPRRPLSPPDLRRRGAGGAGAAGRLRLGRPGAKAFPVAKKPSRPSSTRRLRYGEGAVERSSAGSR